MELEKNAQGCDRSYRCLVTRGKMKFTRTKLLMTSALGEVERTRETKCSRWISPILCRYSCMGKRVTRGCTLALCSISEM